MFESTSRAAPCSTHDPKGKSPRENSRHAKMRGGDCFEGVPPPPLFAQNLKNRGVEGGLIACSITSENVQSPQSKGVEFTGM